MIVKRLCPPKYLLTLLFAAVSLAAAHPFRAGDLAWENSWITILVSIIGTSLAWPHLTAGRPRARFSKGFFFGFISFSCIWYWISYALINFGDLSWATSVVITLILSSYCAVYWGLWACIAGNDTIMSRPILNRLCLWASLWATLEAWRQWFLTGFSWGEWGAAFSFSPFVSGSSSIWGIHGLTFAAIFVSALVSFAWQTRRDFIVPAVFIFGLVAIVSWAGRALPTGSTEDFNIGIVQPNIPQDLKWDPRAAHDNLSKLLGLSYALVPQAPDLVAWPETAYPFLVMSSESSFDFKLPMPLLFGAVVRDGSYNKNSVIQLEGDHSVGRFEKRHLVPFGEYVPLKDYIPFGKVVENVGDFQPGSFAQDTLRVGPRQLNVGPLICYEDIFARSSVSLARKGAEILINFTNDAWYGKTSALAQHATLSHFQSYQTGLPMLRVTNNGQSSLMTPRERTDIPAFAQASDVLTVPVSREPTQTFFVKTYPLMEWIWPLIFVIALIWKRPRKIAKV